MTRELQFSTNFFHRFIENIRLNRKFLESDIAIKKILTDKIVFLSHFYGLFVWSKVPEHLKKLLPVELYFL